MTKTLPGSVAPAAWRRGGPVPASAWPWLRAVYAAARRIGVPLTEAGPVVWWTYARWSRKPAVHARRRLVRFSREQLQVAVRPRAAMSAVRPVTQARARCRRRSPGSVAQATSSYRLPVNRAGHGQTVGPPGAVAHGQDVFGQGRRAGRADGEGARAGRGLVGGVGDQHGGPPGVRGTGRPAVTVRAAPVGQLWPALRPWFAFFLRRAFFLRARFDMSGAPFRRSGRRGGRRAW